MANKSTTADSAAATTLTDPFVAFLEDQAKDIKTLSVLARGILMKELLFYSTHPESIILQTLTEAVGPSQLQIATSVRTMDANYAIIQKLLKQTPNLLQLSYNEVGALFVSEGIITPLAAQAAAVSFSNGEAEEDDVDDLD